MEYKFIAHAFKKLDIKIRNIKIDKKRLWNWKQIRLLLFQGLDPENMERAHAPHFTGFITD